MRNDDDDDMTGSAEPGATVELRIGANNRSVIAGSGNESIEDGPLPNNALAQTRYGGAVAACGLAQGRDLPTTVVPFILRNVALLGVDSVMAPRALRQTAWDRLARDLDSTKLASMVEEISLDQAVEKAQALMAGQVRGRIVVKI